MRERQNMMAMMRAALAMLFAVVWVVSAFHGHDAPVHIPASNVTIEVAAEAQGCLADGAGQVEQAVDAECQYCGASSCVVPTSEAYDSAPAVKSLKIAISGSFDPTNRIGVPDRPPSALLT